MSDEIMKARQQWNDWLVERADWYARLAGAHPQTLQSALRLGRFYDRLFLLRYLIFEGSVDSGEVWLSDDHVQYGYIYTRKIGEVSETVVIRGIAYTRRYVIDTEQSA